MNNTQLIAPPVSTENLPVMESFYTIQGEGYHQGRAAWFVRLGGCDVGCVWCDVKESWDMNAHPKKAIAEILTELKGSPANIVVITGGEPLMHDLSALTTALQHAGYKTHIETSGAYPLSGSWDWICLSPKKFKSPLPEVVAAADELKTVIYNSSDFKWAEQHALLTKPGCRLYLQPEWSKASVIIPSIVDYVKDHPEWELSLQIHKYINVP